MDGNNNNSNGKYDDLLEKIDLNNYNDYPLGVKYMNMFVDHILDHDTLEYKINHAFIIKNNAKKICFDEKVSEMKMTRKKMSDIRYAFTICDDYDKLMDICKYGPQCSKSEFNYLGPSDKGVYLSTLPDTMLKHIDNEYVFLILHQVALFNTQKLNVSADKHGPEPNLRLHDSHCSNKSPTIEMNIDDMYLNSLIYLFDSKPRPRQIYPVAMFVLKKVPNKKLDSFIYKDVKIDDDNEIIAESSTSINVNLNNSSNNSTNNNCDYKIIPSDEIKRNISCVDEEANKKKLIDQSVQTDVNMENYPTTAAAAVAAVESNAVESELLDEQSNQSDESGIPNLNDDICLNVNEEQEHGENRGVLCDIDLNTSVYTDDTDNINISSVNNELFSMKYDDVDMEIDDNDDNSIMNSIKMISTEVKTDESTKVSASSQKSSQISECETDTFNVSKQPNCETVLQDSLYSTISSTSLSLEISLNNQLSNDLNEHDFSNVEKQKDKVNDKPLELTSNAAKTVSHDSAKSSNLETTITSLSSTSSELASEKINEQKLPTNDENSEKQKETVVNETVKPVESIRNTAEKCSKSDDSLSTGSPILDSSSSPSCTISLKKDNEKILPNDQINKKAKEIANDLKKKRLKFTCNKAKKPTDDTPKSSKIDETRTNLHSFDTSPSSSSAINKTTTPTTTTTTSKNNSPSTDTKPKRLNFLDDNDITESIIREVTKNLLEWDLPLINKKDTQNLTNNEITDVTPDVSVTAIVSSNPTSSDHLTKIATLDISEDVNATNNSTTNSNTNANPTTNVCESVIANTANNMKNTSDKLTPNTNETTTNPTTNDSPANMTSNVNEATTNVTTNEITNTTTKVTLNLNETTPNSTTTDTTNTPTKITSDINDTTTNITIKIDDTIDDTKYTSTEVTSNVNDVTTNPTTSDDATNTPTKFTSNVNDNTNAANNDTKSPLYSEWSSNSNKSVNLRRSRSNSSTKSRISSCCKGSTSNRRRSKSVLSSSSSSYYTGSKRSRSRSNSCSSIKSNRSDRSNHSKTLNSIDSEDKTKPIDNNKEKIYERNAIIKLYWENLFIAFEFLCTGQIIIEDIKQKLVVIEDITLAKSPEHLRTMEMSILDVEELNNPVDPTDKVDWTWDYNSTKHYKLLKFKYLFVTRINRLRTVFLQFYSLDLQKSSTEYKVKMHVAFKITDYVTRWKYELESINEKYREIRIKNSHLKDTYTLHQFIKNRSHRKLDDSKQTDNEKHSDLLLEDFNLKLHYLLDLLITTSRPIDKETEEFNETFYEIVSNTSTTQQKDDNHHYHHRRDSSESTSCKSRYIYNSSSRYNNSSRSKRQRDQDSEDEEHRHKRYRRMSNSPRRGDSRCDSSKENRIYYGHTKILFNNLRKSTSCKNKPVRFVDLLDTQEMASLSEILPIMKIDIDASNINTHLGDLEKEFNALNEMGIRFEKIFQINKSEEIEIMLKTIATCYKRYDVQRRYMNCLKMLFDKRKPESEDDFDVLLDDEIRKAQEKLIIVAKGIKAGRYNTHLDKLKHKMAEFIYKYSMTNCFNQ